jgi:hypothetical protein
MRFSLTDLLRPGKIRTKEARRRQVQADQRATRNRPVDQIEGAGDAEDRGGSEP